MIPEVKRIIRGITYDEAKTLARRALGCRRRRRSAISCRRSCTSASRSWWRRTTTKVRREPGRHSRDRRRRSCRHAAPGCRPAASGGTGGGAGRAGARGGGGAGRGRASCRRARRLWHGWLRHRCRLCCRVGGAVRRARARAPRLWSAALERCVGVLRLLQLFRGHGRNPRRLRGRAVGCAPALPDHGRELAGVPRGKACRWWRCRRACSRVPPSGTHCWRSSGCSTRSDWCEIRRRRRSRRRRGISKRWRRGSPPKPHCSTIKPSSWRRHVPIIWCGS